MMMQRTARSSDIIFPYLVIDIREGSSNKFDYDIFIGFHWRSLSK